MTENDANKLIENQISSNSRRTPIKDNSIIQNFSDVNSNLNIFREPEKLETQSKHINRKDSNFDLHDLVKHPKDYENNPATRYLNINHLACTIDCLREICSKSPIDILCVQETKLDSCYPDAQI